MNTFKIIKTGLGIAASIGAGGIVTNIVNATTPAGISKIGKILNFVGGAAIAAAVGNIAAENMEALVESTGELTKSVLGKNE